MVLELYKVTLEGQEDVCRACSSVTSWEPNPGKTNDVDGQMSASVMSQRSPS